ncbi:MAG: hypothetical protein HOD60_06415 [Candidatus Nitrosopelagicus sp.]|jgi:hypothetical protein|nr:hypothetical protein [Candidatus Nitrosopelagicus sp.]
MAILHGMVDSESSLLDKLPNGFQILCHNCNFAKGVSKDNKCPHEK